MKLYYYKASEFDRGDDNWFNMMDQRLLVLLDVFRYRWGMAVQISPAGGSLGRHLGPLADSDHNLDRWPYVYAADVMPKGMDTRANAQRAVQIAVDVGFTAIGLYPDWKPHPGLHLSTRPSREPGAPATWGGVMDDGVQDYIALSDTVERFPTA